MPKSTRLVIIILISASLFGQEDEFEYGIVPNYSVNIYTGYPIIKASSFNTYDKSRPVAGISIGTPYGYYGTNFFVNANIEIFRYIFRRTVNDQRFGGTAFQIGGNTGLFIGNLSVSVTAATGVFHAGTGFIGGLNIDLPVGEYILNNVEIPDSMELHVEALEVRFTTRSNIVQKKDGTTGWIDGGFSLGYEF
tara:strand:- start:268 stop:846 length:579 start_codon:yes stop_codon:yes gene_type:complete